MADALIFVLSLGAVVVTGGLVAMVIPNPSTGLARLGHLPECLTEVMAGRYIAFFVFSLGAAYYGDPIVLFGLFIGFAVASAADTYIYARKGGKFGPHLAAGVASVIGAALSLIAAGAT